MIHRVSPLAAFLLLAAPAAARAQDDPLGEGGDQAEPPPSPAEPPPSPDADTGGDDELDSLEAEQLEAERAQARSDNLVRPLGAEAIPEGEVSYAHGEQFGLRLGVAVPFVFAVKYGDGPICSHNLTDEGRPETLCRRVGNALLDVDLGYGITDSLELTLLGRFGITEQELTESRQVILGLGVRSYGSPTSQVKAYIGARLIAELTVDRDEGVRDWGSADIGGRGEGGIAIDAMRQLGFYLQLGATFQVLRGFYLIGDVSAGVQVRLP